MSHFSKLTLASQLVLAINLENGHHSPFTMESVPEVPGEMVALEAVVAVLGQEHDVLAACYNSSEVVGRNQLRDNPRF